MLADTWPFLFSSGGTEKLTNMLVFAQWSVDLDLSSRVIKETVSRLLADRNYGCATVETGRDYACMSIKQQPPRVKLHIPASHALGRLRVPRHTLLAAADCT